MHSLHLGVFVKAVRNSRIRFVGYYVGFAPIGCGEASFCEIRKGFLIRYPTV